MWNVRHVSTLLATVVLAAVSVRPLATLPPVVGFLLAVGVACGWCFFLESPARSAERRRSEPVWVGVPLIVPTRPSLLPHLPQGAGLVAVVLAIAGLTIALRFLLRVTDPTIAALAFLLIVVIAASVSSWRVGITASLLAFLSFNFFFLPPTGTLMIAEPRHWVALFALLVVGLIANYLSSEVRIRADEVTRAEVLRHGAELKASLLASLGHDLKTPLTAVTVAADSLSASWLTDRQRQEQAAIVKAELTRLNRLFGHLIDMARIETQAVAVEAEWVAPEEIVEAAALQVEGSLDRRRIRLDWEPNSQLVRLDPRLTSAALAHVLENAAQHSPAGSPVAVSVKTDGHEVRIAVRDCGSGLRAISRATRDKTGMGLSISAGLLSAQGGRMWGENHADGGALFTLTIPTETRRAADLEPEFA